MSFETWQVLFGVPLLTMLLAWIGLVSGWRTENDRARRLLITVAMVFPTAAALLACGGLVYVQRGGRVHDALGFYGDGVFLSLPGVILGFALAVTFRRWFSMLGLAVSTWMFLLFCLMASAAD